MGVSWYMHVPEPQGCTRVACTCVAAVGYTSWADVVGMHRGSRMMLIVKRIHIVCTCGAHTCAQESVYIETTSV